jgi:ubiquinone/menaquinone biosynthesis C-methylase UbiE
MSEINSSSFNTVIDKATLDSVLCGDNSVPNAEKMMQEIYRVLAPGGVYVCISYGDDEHRRKYFVTSIVIIELSSLGNFCR